MVTLSREIESSPDFIPQLEARSCTEDFKVRLNDRVVSPGLMFSRIKEVIRILDNEITRCNAPWRNLRTTTSSIITRNAPLIGWPTTGCPIRDQSHRTLWRHYLRDTSLN